MRVNFMQNTKNQPINPTVYNVVMECMKVSGTIEKVIPFDGTAEGLSSAIFEFAEYSGSQSYYSGEIDPQLVDIGNKLLDVGTLYISDMRLDVLKPVTGYIVVEQGGGSLSTSDYKLQYSNHLEDFIKLGLSADVLLSVQKLGTSTTRHHLNGEYKTVTVIKKVVD